jgi:hypothetical protein
LNVVAHSEHKPRAITDEIALKPDLLRFEHSAKGCVLSGTISRRPSGQRWQDHDVAGHAATAGLTPGRPWGPTSATFSKVNVQKQAWANL